MSVSLSDILGNTIMNTQAANLNTSNIAAGMYILRVVGTDGEASTQLVIKQ